MLLQTANDVVVNPGSPARMMEFALWVDGEYVYDQRSDRLIIASHRIHSVFVISWGPVTRIRCHRDCAYVSAYADLQTLGGAWEKMRLRCWISWTLSHK